MHHNVYKIVSCCSFGVVYPSQNGQMDLFPCLARQYPALKIDFLIMHYKYGSSPLRQQMR